MFIQHNSHVNILKIRLFLNSSRNHYLDILCGTSVDDRITKVDQNDPSGTNGWANMWNRMSDPRFCFVYMIYTHRWKVGRTVGPNVPLTPIRTQYTRLARLEYMYAISGMGRNRPVCWRCQLYTEDRIARHPSL